MSESKVIETNLVTAPARLFYKCNILWQLFVLNMPTDAKECRENNWYCTVYTYKYHGKHVYIYSTSLEHNVTLKNLHAYCYCMLCFSTFLQTSACWLLDQTHTLTTLVLYLDHQLTPPHSVLFPITAVAPPPHTPGPAQTETTSQPQPSKSLWEAARKWAM